MTTTRVTIIGAPWGHSVSHHNNSDGEFRVGLIANWAVEK
jgi:hypothetical protein